MLRRLAAERGVSMASIIRDALDRGLASSAAASKRDRAIKAIGGFRSGRHDISENHDAYLAEAFGD